MNPVKVIGLNGPAGAGKNYLAHLFERSKAHVRIEAFADPLKYACMALFDLDEHDVFTTEGKKKVTDWDWEDLHSPMAKSRFGKMTVREILQTVGTELMRDSWCQDHWTRLAEKKIKRAIQDHMNFVIFTDVRFDNEVKLIKKYDGQIWSIQGRKTEGVPNHASERYDIKPDVLIINDNTATDAGLYNQIEEALKL